MTSVPANLIEKAQQWARTCWAADPSLSTEATGALARGYVEGAMSLDAVDLAAKVARVGVLHKASTLTEDVWYEDCERDGCDTSKGCNGHNTVVCDHEECWAVGADGDALPNPWPCATARALGVLS